MQLCTLCHAALLYQSSLPCNCVSAPSRLALGVPFSVPVPFSALAHMLPGLTSQRPPTERAGPGCQPQPSGLCPQHHCSFRQHQPQGDDAGRHHHAATHHVSESCTGWWDRNALHKLQGTLYWDRWTVMLCTGNRVLACCRDLLGDLQGVTEILGISSCNLAHHGSTVQKRDARQESDEEDFVDVDFCVCAV